MKTSKYILITLVVIIIVISLIRPVSAQQSAPIKVAVYVDGTSRTAIIFVDKDGLHIQYFTLNALQFLGEEIFKDGQKISDNYKENDGLKN